MKYVKSKFATLKERQESIPGATYEIPEYSTTSTDNLPEIGGLNDLAGILLDAVTENNIVIYGDYDVDGIMSVGIMWRALLMLSNIASSITGKSPSKITAMVPDRFNEGYGFQTEQAGMIQNSIILLLDNGISSNDGIATARKNGNKVYVVDHHERGADLPDADLIVNPHAVPGSRFDNYCAAGLCYRLMRRMFELLSAHIDPAAMKAGLDESLFMAALATVADVVPMLYENRIIVREGMKAIPERWQTVIDTLLMTHKKVLEEGDIAYKIAPAINAVSRLGELDNDFLNALFFDRNMTYIADILCNANDRRKMLTDEAKAVLTEFPEEDQILVLQSETIHRGISGIIAGYVSEKQGKPTIMFGPETNGEYVGSARAPKGTVHLKQLLDEVSTISPDLIVRYGGHECAAGLTIKKEKLDELRLLLNMIGLYESLNQETVVYDYDLQEDDNWFKIYEGISKYGPYGAENPAPLVRITRRVRPENVRLLKKLSLKFSVDGYYEVLGFNMADKCCRSGDAVYDGIGTLQINTYKNGRNAQLNLKALNVTPVEEEASPGKGFFPASIIL